MGTLNNIKIMILNQTIFFYDLRLILTRGSLKTLCNSLLKNITKDDFNIMEYVFDKNKYLATIRK